MVVHAAAMAVVAFVAVTSAPRLLYRTPAVLLLSYSPLRRSSCGACPCISHPCSGFYGGGTHISSSCRGRPYIGCSCTVALIKYPNSSNLRPLRVDRFFSKCSLLWQSMHKSSRLSQFNTTSTSLIFSGVMCTLWCTILPCGRPQRSHTPYLLAL